MLICAVLLIGCTGQESQSIHGTPGPTKAPSTMITDYASEPLGKDMVIREIQGGFYIVTHSFPWPHNSLLVEMQNSDILLVDTPYTPEATDELLKWESTKFGNRHIVAINTGYHYDNLGGNGALIAAGIKVYGSDAIPVMLDQRGAALRALTLSWLADPKYSEYYEAHKNLKYVPPNALYPLQKGLTLNFGSESVVVYYPGPTHTVENVVVYFGERNILFGGCMILAGDAVGNTADADLAEWPKSIERLRRFKIDLLIPGHGDRMDPQLIDHTLQVLAAAK
ncbi:MAG TPA: MBL fold metallo-hydrolase [Anaerolineales bacterium]|nr:MBL fold metallo-hydrolase [Anaerolineales bacterium]